MTGTASRSADSSAVALGIVRGVSYGLFRPPDPFLPQLRALGARLVRIFLYWSQIEPEPGRFRFDALDTFFGELDGSEQVWVTVCSSSPWATRQATKFLPPSPAKDPATYRRLLRELMQHAAGRVHYWQCDNEPSNVGLTWAGTADEYLSQLRELRQAQREHAPRAQLVLGGAPYNLPVLPADSPERRFFELLLRDGRELFDLFDLHLYGDPERVPDDLETVRGWMRAHGYERPIVAGEYGGPTPDRFPEAMAALEPVVAALFAGSSAPGVDISGAPTTQQTPEQAALAALYQRMPSLPPQLQMFLAGCPSELEQRRERIYCREIVTRNLHALAAGVRLTACWKLAPEVASYEDPFSLMELFYGKLLLLEYRGGVLGQRRAAAETFALLSERLAGVEQVRRVAVPAQPSLRLFEVHRRERGAMLVVWNQGDAFAGEAQPGVPFRWPWRAGSVHAIDALRQAQPVGVAQQQLSLQVSVTPVFIAAD